MNLPTQKNEKENNIEYHLSNNNNNVALESQKKLNFFEMNLKFSNKIKIDYNKFDFQKGEQSPKFLFRKRKFPSGEKDLKDNKTLLNNRENTSREKEKEKDLNHHNNNNNNMNNINSRNIQEMSNYFLIFISFFLKI